jgi:branched-chain amino acid transport system ATP-binding protein
MQADTILETRNLTMRFGGLTAVKAFSAAIPRRGIVGLIGPNGAGKTTCFNMITGFYKPTEGQVLFSGSDITGTPPHHVCRSGIARTFQNIRLFGNETVLENVMIGCHPGRRPAGGRPWSHSSSRREARRRGKIRELLKVVDLETWQPRSQQRLRPSGGWRSPARWRPSPPSCCWMSLRPA